jgi:hypothetical protein
MTSTNRRIGAIVLFAALAAIAFATPVSAEDNGTQEAELKALLHYFLENSSTEEAHAKFWADDLAYTSSNGTRFGQDEIMQGFAVEPDTREAADDAGPTVVYTGEDIKVQVFGTTAIVTFRLVGTPDDGSAKAEYYNSGTFLNRQGSWRAVSWQATIIPAES